MKTSRFSDAQIIAILKQAESGSPVPELCREREHARFVEAQCRNGAGGDACRSSSAFARGEREHGVTLGARRGGDFDGHRLGAAVPPHDRCEGRDRDRGRGQQFGFRDDHRRRVAVHVADRGRGSAASGGSQCEEHEGCGGGTATGTGTWHGAR